MPLDPSIIAPNTALLQSIANPQPIPTIADIQAKQLALQNARLQSQSTATDIQQKQLEMQQQQEVVQAFHDNNGDVDKAIAQLQARGNPQAFTLAQHRDAMQKAVDEHQKTLFDNETHKADLIGRSANSVLNAPEALRPTIYQGQKDYLESTGIVKPGQLPPMYTGPEMEPQLKALVTQSQSAKDQVETAKAESERKQAEAKTVTEGLTQTKIKAEQPGIEAKAAREQYANDIPGLQRAAALGPTAYQAAYNALPPARQALAPDPKSNPTPDAVLASGQTAPEQVASGQRAQELQQGAQRVILARERAQLDRELQSGDELSNDAKSTAARMYLQTGQMPQLGMGKAATKNRSDIMNLAAKMQPDADLGTAKAGFAADENSLKKLQATRDSTVAFENTAGKNLDQFMQQIKGVIDTGSPLLNQPLRTLSDTAFGSTNQAAVNAARMVATTEIAKVLNNPGGNAALSDSARAEANQLLGPNVTVAQAYKVASLLRQDMANRRQSYDDQLTEIKNRIGGNKPAPAAAPTGQTPTKATKRYNPTTGKIEAIP